MSASNVWNMRKLEQSLDCSVFTIESVKHRKSDIDFLSFYLCFHDRDTLYQRIDDRVDAMVEAGLDLTPMITHRFNYRDFEKGFEAMNSGMSGKVVLDWTK